MGGAQGGPAPILAGNLASRCSSQATAISPLPVCTTRLRIPQRRLCHCVHSAASRALSPVYRVHGPAARQLDASWQQSLGAAMAVVRRRSRRSRPWLARRERSLSAGRRQLASRLVACCVTCVSVWPVCATSAGCRCVGEWPSLRLVFASTAPMLAAHVRGRGYTPPCTVPLTPARLRRLTRLCSSGCGLGVQPACSPGGNFSPIQSE